MAEFAVSDYLEEYGVLPRSLEVLELDSAVLIDPFSTSQASLQYRHGDGEFTLYSVGPDGDDDGGILDPNGRYLQRHGDHTAPGERSH
jgi:hypothetical protein